MKPASTYRTEEVEKANYAETLVLFYQSTWHNISEDKNLYVHGCES
jgi:hypothetical protein